MRTIAIAAALLVGCFSTGGNGTGIEPDPGGMAGSPAVIMRPQPTGWQCSCEWVRDSDLMWLAGFTCNPEIDDAETVEDAVTKAKADCLRSGQTKADLTTTISNAPKHTLLAPDCTCTTP